MKKILLATLAAVAILTGCQQSSEEAKETNETNQTTQEEAQLQTVNITISEFGTSTEDKSIEVEEGTTAMDALKESFKVEHTDGFITSIDGVAADETEQEFWAFLVNNELATVGAGDYKLKDGDTITFDLQNW